MATPTFNHAPETDWGYLPTMPVAIFKYAGQATEQRAALQDVERETIEWPMRKTASEMATIKEFFRLRGQSRDAFYVRLPRGADRTGVSLGTSVSGQTAFVLPTSGNNKRDYPIGTATYTVYDDGGATATTVTVDTDTRTFTLDAAPTSGSVMTVDYKAYLLVRLKEPFEWTGLGPDFFAARPSFVEVPE